MSLVLPEALRELVADVVRQAGLELFDLELNGRVLRVFVQSDQGVTIETCVQVSRALSDRLDQVDPIPGRYFLEVSSPGLERRLRGIADFEREVGKYAHLVTPQGVFDGTIRRVAGTEVVLAIPGPEGEESEVRFSIDDIRRANLKVADDALFARKGKPVKNEAKRPRATPAASHV